MRAYYQGLQKAVLESKKLPTAEFKKLNGKVTLDLSTKDKKGVARVKLIGQNRLSL